MENETTQLLNSNLTEATNDVFDHETQINNVSLSLLLFDFRNTWQLQNNIIISVALEWIHEA